MQAADVQALAVDVRITMTTAGQCSLVATHAMAALAAALPSNMLR
jgi:hypothetical protein